MRALQFENQNERLVYELTRLDRPGTPEKAVAVLLEKHPRKRHDANRSAITKPTRWDEGDLHTAHDYFKKTKNSTRPLTFSPRLKQGDSCINHHCAATEAVASYTMSDRRYFPCAPRYGMH